jgi:hypothetical protein
MYLGLSYHHALSYEEIERVFAVIKEYRSRRGFDRVTIVDPIAGNGALVYILYVFACIDRELWFCDFEASDNFSGFEKHGYLKFPITAKLKDASQACRDATESTIFLLAWLPMDSHLKPTQEDPGRCVGKYCVENGNLMMLLGENGREMCTGTAKTYDYVEKMERYAERMDIVYGGRTMLPLKMYVDFDFLIKYNPERTKCSECKKTKPWDEFSKTQRMKKSAGCRRCTECILWGKGDIQQ